MSTDAKAWLIIAVSTVGLAGCALLVWGWVRMILTEH